MNIANFYSCTILSFPQGMCTITKTCYKISYQQKTSTNKILKTCNNCQFEKKRPTIRTRKQENAGVQRSAQVCMSLHHITNAKRGWESPRIKRIQAPETRDGVLLLSSSDRSKRSQTGITVHNTCTKTHKTGFFFLLSPKKAALGHAWGS